MRLENTIDVSFTGELDVILSLVDVDTIVVRKLTLCSDDANALILRSDLVVDKGDELASGASSDASTNGKVINLATDKNNFIVNNTTVEVTFMSSILEANIAKNPIDHRFEEVTSFWMTLKGL